MANVLQIKRSSTASNVPSAGELAQGELAINIADERLFSKNSSNVVFEITDHDSLTNYVANEHIDWTLATANFDTSGTLNVDDLATFGNDIQLADNGALRLGDAQDVSMLFSGVDFYIDVASGADYRFRNVNGTKTCAVFLDAGGVELYHNNVKKLETTASGATVTGTLAATTVTGANVTSGVDPGHTHTAYLTSVAFNDLTAKTSGTGNYTTTGIFTAQYFEGSGLGPLTTPGNEDVYVGGYGLMGDRTSNPIYVSNVSGPVALNHAGVHGGAATKLATTATGVTVTGTMAATTVTGANVTSGVDPGHTHTAYAPATNDYALTTGDTFTGSMIFTPSATFNGGATFNNNITMGAGDDIVFPSDGVIDWPAMEIYATANDGVIRVIGGTGTDLFLNTNTTENSLICRGNSGVELYYDNALAFQTDSYLANSYGMGAQVRDGTNVMRPVGMNVMPVYEIDANDTFDLAHVGHLWHKDLNAAVTFTTTNSSTLPDGATYVVHNDDTEDLTIAAGASTTLYWIEAGSAPAAGNVTVKQGGIVTVYRYSASEWWCWGAKEAAAGGGGGLTNAQDITGGIRVDGTGTATNLDIYTSSAGTQVARFGWDTGGPYWRSTSHGAIIAIEAEDAGGTVRTILTADPDSTTELRADTNLELSVTAGADTALLATANADVALFYNNIEVFRTQSYNSTSISSGAEVLTHRAAWYDVGLNVLPTFNFNISDTLEARHCGMITGKNNTSAYTLTGPDSTATANVDDFPVNGVCTVANLGTSGNYTINDTTTCTMYYLDGSSAPQDIVGSGTLAPGGIVTLWRYSTTAIYIWGSGFTP